MPYEKLIKLVKKMIEAEEVPGNSNALSIVMTLTARYGAGDALAGWILEKLIQKNREAAADFTEKVLGEPKPSLAGLLKALKVLSKKYKTFRALDYLAATGSPKHLYKVAEELGVEVEEG